MVRDIFRKTVELLVLLFVRAWAMRLIYFMDGLKQSEDEES